MSHVLQQIILHLRISHQLHVAAEEVLNDENNTKNNVAFTKAIEDAEKKYKIKGKLKKKVNILKEKYEYIELRDKILKALKEIAGTELKDMTSVCSKYKLSSKLLLQEFEKYKTTTEYQYDQFIKKEYEFVKKDGIFTYVEEFSMLRFLIHTWKTNTDTDCYCRACALIYLITRTSEYANEDQKKRLDSATVKANWIVEYEMRHHDDIFLNFEDIDNCKNEIVKSFSKMKPPYTIKNSYQNILSIFQQKSSQSYQEDFNISTKRKRNDPQPSTSGQQLPCNVSPPTSISHALQPKDSQSYQEGFNTPMIDSSHIREKIKSYLILESYIEQAITQFIKKEKTKEELLATFQFDASLLDYKIDMTNKKERYWKVKDKIEEAIKYIAFFSELNITNKLIDFAANKIDVDKTVLTAEYDKYKILNDKTVYEYEEYSVNEGGDFTYKEEFALLQQLSFLMKYNFRNCFCKICVLECFRSLIFELAKHYNKLCYSYWSKQKNSNLKWLSLFMIGYTTEISAYKFSDICNVQPQT